MNQHPIDLFHVYGWRGSKGPFFIDSTSDADAATAQARTKLGEFTRTTVQHVREHRIVWDSAHVCNDGWLCEDHPTEAWKHDGCGAAGMPCPICRPTLAPRDDDN